MIKVMAEYIRKIPSEPTFSQKGLTGFRYALTNENVEVYFVDVKQGHDKYIISKNCSHIYYILEGEGTFDIDGTKYNVNKGAFIEVPPNVEFTYSGKMRLLLIMNPPWFEGNEQVTKKNPSVE